MTARRNVRARLVAPRRFELADRPVGRVREGGALVRILGCGVCASSLPLWEGRPWFDYPRPAGEPGHEGWGIVEAVAPDVTELSPGDLVATLGLDALAQYLVCPATECVRLPHRLAGRPFPGEALGCGFNVVRRAGLEPAQRIAVVGGGFLGLLVGAIAHHLGAVVVVASRRAQARQLAEQLGAAATIDSNDPETALARARRLAPKGWDCVIECTGLQAPLDLASELVRERGRLVIAGYHQDGRRQVDMQSWNWRGIDVVNAHERDPARYRQGIQEAARAAAEGWLRPEQLVSHSFTLEEVGAAFELVGRAPDGLTKAVLRMD